MVNVIKYLEDLWILKDCGIIIFSKVRTHAIDDQCLGGLTSALYYFARQGLHETLLRFTTDKFEYKVIEREDLLFVATFPAKTKERVALNELEYIADRFLELYPKEVVEGWDHNMSRFLGFQEEVMTKKEKLGDFISYIGRSLENVTFISNDR